METDNELAALAMECERLVAGQLAKNTRKSYDDSWGRFEKWCTAKGQVALPTSPHVLALWATSMLRDGLAVTSIETRISAVAHFHRKAGFQTDTLTSEVAAVLKGSRRMKHELSRAKKPLTVEQLWRIARVLDADTLRGCRDRAIIVLAFCAAFRRSEVSALDLDDVAFTKQGLLIHLRRSKTDQEGEGRFVGIFAGDREDTCPVRTLRAWLKMRGEHAGPLFYTLSARGDRMTERRLSPGAAVDAVKRGVRSIGLNPADYGGHSLRSGYCTAAAENGATEMDIMLRTGHRSVVMVHRYVRPVKAFGRNPLAGKV